jgi:methyl-accepting chemotaxis protein
MVAFTAGMAAGWPAGERSGWALAAVVTVLAQVGWGRQRWSAAQIGTLDRAVQAAAGGDLSALQQLPAASGSGPIVALTVSVAGLGERVGRLVGVAQLAGFVLTARSAEIMTVAQEMAVKAENSAEQAAKAATVVAVMSENIGSVATAVTELESTIREIAHHAAQAAIIARAAAKDATGANEAVTGLTLACARVDEVVASIQLIAGHTHLLALNATIEAARAGEAGRGFTVVAHEVKTLAQTTSESTKSAHVSVATIRAGSTHAGEAMATIVTTCEQVRENQTYVAAAVEQQTVTTREIGQRALDAASTITQIVEGVAAIASDARMIAYAGAHTGAVAAELAGHGEQIEQALAGFALSTVSPPEVQQVEATQATVEADGRITVHNSDFGDGINQLDYRGQWKHSRGNLDGDAPNSYTGFPGDTATLRFIGTQVDVYSVRGPNHGTVEISIDGQPPVECDQYAEPRSPGHLLFQSPQLGRGEHTLIFTVTGHKNPDSQYLWAVLERIQIRP